MSPRAFVMAAIMLSTCLLFAVSMLAMLSAESNHVMRQAPRQPSTWETCEPSIGEPCDGVAPRKWTDLMPPGPGRILPC